MKDKHDIILVQVYVDDIIFGSTKKSWCDEFEALMKSRFQISSLGGVTLLGNAKSKPMWPLLLQKLNMLLLQAANPVYHSKTKHIAIRHHFIRDAYEKKLIQVLKIHTDDNVADLLTNAFDVSRFQFLVVSIGMINPQLHWLKGGNMNQAKAASKEKEKGVELKDV
ncbi:hypothetical protein Tco_1445024, partial [Tanacetum coccineum]